MQVVQNNNLSLFTLTEMQQKNEKAIFIDIILCKVQCTTFTTQFIFNASNRNYMHYARTAKLFLALTLSLPVLTFCTNSALYTVKSQQKSIRHSKSRYKHNRLLFFYICIASAFAVHLWRCMFDDSPKILIIHYVIKI